MKMTKKTSVAGAYARKEAYTYEGKDFEADLKNGDTIKILNEGSVITGQFGDQQVFSVETRNGPKNLTLNQKTINVMVDTFGDDSQAWIGKTVAVALEKTIINNKRCIVVYLLPEGYEVDEWGDIIRIGSDAPHAPEDEEAIA